MDTSSTVVRRVLPTVCRTVLAVLAVGAPVVVALADPTPGRLVVGFTLVALFRQGRPATAESVWKSIPRRQYGGRHVEFGGLSRDEQESALDDVRREAAERRRVERER